jgi:hypothetical protein
MDITSNDLLIFSIIIPVVISLVRFSKINQAYYPFIFCIWTGFINESTSAILLNLGHYNVINFNIYLLIESLLITWQFNLWGLFKKMQNTFPIIMGALLVAWCSNSIFTGMKTFNSYFLIGYSFMISMMSIVLFNRLIVTERKNLLKNPVFIICVAFVIFYTFNILSEIFWMYSITKNWDLASKMNKIIPFTSFITYILYSFALLWMPSKQKFTLPSS